MIKVKTIIAGGRKFNNFGLLASEVDAILQGNFEEGTKMEVFSGGCKGVDKFGEKFANYRGHGLRLFGTATDHLPEDEWKQININMAAEAEVLIAFWDGVSEGTKHMIDTANERGLLVFVVYYYMKPLFNFNLNSEYTLASLLDF